MPVYPGDPDVLIAQIQTLEKQGWNLSSLTLTTHLATHVNVPSHMKQGGKTLDDIPIDQFAGLCVLYDHQSEFDPTIGVIFATQSIDMALAERIVLSPPKFVGQTETFEFDEAVEKYLLEHDIISFENLKNTHLLPQSFTFYGFPLPIAHGDGSPVRAIAAFE